MDSSITLKTGKLNKGMDKTMHAIIRKYVTSLMIRSVRVSSSILSSILGLISGPNAPYPKYPNPQ
jgi:hypothetical protein